ncbi:SNF2 family N-terminal domain-containing protein [Crassisporium funariophilum]|nr:SNF2 family N-terminal domain-containing protein [Crassisporium funariophilum]
MPAFQSPGSFVEKRKHDDADEELGSRKRVARSSDYTSASTSLAEKAGDSSQETVWMVQWRIPQNRKHKTWDGDAVLVLNGMKDALLYDSEGTIMTKGKAPLPLYEGKSFFFGPKEIELERPIPRSQFLSGVCFGSSVDTIVAPSVIHGNCLTIRKFMPPSLSSRNLIPEIIQDPSLGGKPSDYAPKRQELSSSIAEEAGRAVTIQSSHWTANWRKPQGRKNKSWDGDAYISHTGEKILMISEDGKIMGSALWKGQKLCPGFNTFIGGKEVELDCQISASQLPNFPPAGVVDPSHMALAGDSETVTPRPKSPAKQVITANNFYAPAPPKAPKGQLHDPLAPDALVMKGPNKEHIKRFNKRNLPIVSVVVDPILSRKMRPHQKEGVKFLYECVMGLRKHEGQGCILADEMGLGKTLQTIALVWTLLRQNMYAGPLPVVQKVLIVCPVSLVNNWKAEFHKWLGRDRVGIITCDKNSEGVDMFGRSKVHQVLIIGYERLRTVIDKLTSIHPPVGLIVCDEGHRLKSANNKTAAVFKALDTRRRVILSGTPIQNDLGEFHAMAEFCNPRLLDDYTVFRRVYENPILKSRTPEASEKEIEVGEARTAQLLAIAKSFVLRRDASLLKNHLPPKSEYVVFITPTALQLSMFSTILNPDKLNDLIQSSTAESLALINILTKISNSPILLKATADSAKNKQQGSTASIQRVAVDDATKLLPAKAHVTDMSLSGKLIALAKMLKVLRQHTTEKCVLVSHYTSTLNILEAYCKKTLYSYYRLDGQTPQNKRQEYVNTFNKGNQHQSFIFLLSSKAGGVGINLIGASRLFLIDSDWNPSHDLQSMARCHRDGQKRPVFIYRFLTAGAIDEKIYQRQVTKLALSDSLIGSGATNSKSDSFTRKDLRDIFRIHTDTGCNTHDLLDCGCQLADNMAVSEQQSIDDDHEDENDPILEKGFVTASEVRPESLDVEKAYLQKKKAGLAALSEWNHINCLVLSASDHIHDDVLRKIISNTAEKTGNSNGERTQLETLLSGVDITAIQAMDKLQSIRDVPGGTISFLFEKCSTTILADDDNDE